jgi:FGGY-family pentulose kinase
MKKFFNEKDHRAHDETEFINATQHPCLRSVGGKISIEMDPPKILWLKNKMPDTCYARVAHFFSLPDYLVWRCSGVDTRSVCTTTCKWLYKADEGRWDATFWQAIGLGELTMDNFARIGTHVQTPFSPVPNLTVNESTAKLTGLIAARTKVGVSMIDAHAGGVGAISIAMGYVHAINAEKRVEHGLTEIVAENILVLVSGTSACLMSTSKQAVFVEGVWGPYYSAMVPQMWLNEAGQSLCGKLVDTVVESHPEYNSLIKLAAEKNREKYDILFDILDQKTVNDWEKLSKLTNDVHIYPDFHGNRSPLSDPNMTGSVCGLSLDHSVDNLAVMYLATLQALAYQTKHIVDVLSGRFRILVLIGGLGRNQAYAQTMSDVCRLPVLLTDSANAVVLFGAAIAGASNYYVKCGFKELVERFSKASDESNTRLIVPSRAAGLASFHEKKYRVFRFMLEDQRKYRAIMNE